MNVKRSVISMGVLASMLFVLSAPADLFAQKRKELAMGPYFQTLKPNDYVDASIGRGKKLYNELGCAGCHPRGGTIGGTAVDASGTRMNIPIPTLKGAALHYPRRAASGFMATIGMMNDL